MIDLREVIGQDLGLDEDQHRETVLAIRVDAKRIAEIVKNVRELSRDDALLAADLIIAGASQISTDKKSAPGRKRQIPEVARLLYAVKVVHEKKSQNAAVAEVAEQYQVSEPGVKKFLGLTGEEPKKGAAFRKTESAMAYSKASHWITE